MNFLPTSPSGCLLTAKSSPPPHPGLLSNPHFPPLSPRVHQQTHFPVWGMQGCGMDHLCRSHSVLSAQTGLFTLLPQPQKLPFCPILFPHQCGGFPGCRSLSSASAAPPSSADPIPLPFLFFFPSFFHPTWLCGDLSYRFRCPSSSAFSQCSVRAVPSIDVFLMHLWREMNSMSSYSSAILVLLLFHF